MGGWAVYLTVNENFKKTWNRDYHGSKDIDIGFHIDKNDNYKTILNSPFKKSIDALIEDGFEQVTHHLVKRYHTESSKLLSHEESLKIPQPFMFEHYVDPIVDFISPNVTQLLGSRPIDEPLLLSVFKEGKHRWENVSGFNIMIPDVEILIGCKVNALPGRNGHKRTKDIADIFALIWYSGIQMDELIMKLLSVMDKLKIIEVLSEISEEDYDEAEKALDLERSYIQTTLKGFIDKLRVSDMPRISTNDSEAWKMPFNINYDTYKKLIAGLYRSKADSKHVDSAYLSKILGVHKKTLKSNLSFLRSVNVLEGDSQNGYKLTIPMGQKYAKAISSDDRAGIKESSYELITGNQNLKQMNEFISLNNPSLTQIFNYIKTEGRYSPGSGNNPMNAPFMTGSRTLLHIFKDADLIQYDLQIDPKPMQLSKRHNLMEKKSNKESKRSKIKNISKYSKIQGPEPTESRFTDEEFLHLTFGNNILIVLPKKEIKRYWQQAQDYMNLYLRNYEEGTSSQG